MAYTKKHAQFSSAWARIQKEGCDPVWNDYGNFREWSELRWAENATLEKVFPELPWSPDNAFWLRGKDPDCWTPEWSRAYRKAPMPKENPCKGCRSAAKCTKICPARARWWDAKMKELREKWFK